MVSAYEQMRYALQELWVSPFLPMGAPILSPFLAILCNRLSNTYDLRDGLRAPGESKLIQRSEVLCCSTSLSMASNNSVRS